MVCRDDWHAELRSTRTKLAQAEQTARAKDIEVEDLRKAYEVLMGPSPLNIILLHCLQRSSMLHVVLVAVNP